MTIDSDHVGLSEQDRALIYARVGLSQTQLCHVELLVQQSGLRKVGSGALRNVRVSHPSKKNGAQRWLESHTCEQVFALELEFDPTVLGYYTQVLCRRVKRITSHGRLHVSSAHVDFLVFRNDAMELVECKTETWLETEAADKDSHWKRRGQTWFYNPYADWANALGLRFSVWTPPKYAGTYLRNQLACYAVMADDPRGYERKVVDSALKKIAQQPMTIDDLMEAVPSFSGRTALWLLANSKAYGPWKSTPIDMTDRFVLYHDRDQAELADAGTLLLTNEAQAQPHVLDPVLTASTTDLAKARKRFERLRSIEEGTDVPTRRMQQLASRVRKAVASGQNALSACMTHYSSSGNREPRVLPEQDVVIEHVIQRLWNSGRIQRPGDLYFAYQEECDKRGVEPCGRARLDARRRSENPTRHLLASGGFRAYHSKRPATDPRFRSQTPLGYGQVLHVDSSVLDNRSAPDLSRGFEGGRATFYVGVDDATGHPMAHALIFGPSRTEGLAILMREFVQRHGFLPQMIHVDRGPENEASWMTGFCEGCISLRISPTAGSAWNGLAESTIKQVNDQVAHRMPGSTVPDQKGRKIDGRFKSRKQAKTSFLTILRLFVQLLYEDLPRRPDAQGLCPIEKKDRLLQDYGVFGTPCTWNDDFLIRTSISLDKYNVDPQKGIRTLQGYFTSDEFIEANRHCKPRAVRTDCCDPYLMWALIKETWFKVFHSRVQSAALFAPEEKLFELCAQAATRASTRGVKEILNKSRYERIERAKAAEPATSHLAPTRSIPAIEELPAEPGPSLPQKDVHWADLEPYKDE